MRKTLAFLLMIVMAFTFVVPAMAAGTEAFALTAGQSEVQPQAKGNIFYARVNTVGSDPIQGVGEYNIAANTVNMYQDVPAEIMFAAEYAQNEGAVYAGIQLEYQSNEALVRYNSLEDFRAGKYEQIGRSSLGRIIDLTMDYTTNTLYAVVDNYLAYQALCVVDTVNGGFSMVGKLNPTEGGKRVAGVAVDEDGVMYAVTGANDASESAYIYTVDKTTGEMTVVGPTNTSPTTNMVDTNLLYDYDTHTMYLLSANNGGAYAQKGLYRVNLNTGAATFVNSAGDCQFLTIFTVCDDDSLPTPPSEEPTGLEMTPKSISLVSRDSYTLKATVLPAGAYIEDRTVTWKSSDENVAVVSASGVVTAKEVGTATITATSNVGNFSDTCTVTVTDAQAAYRDISEAVNKAAYGTDGFILFATDTKEGGYPWQPYNFGNRGTVGASSNQGVNNSVSYIENWEPLTLTGGSTVKFDYTISTADEGAAGDALRLYINGDVIVNDYMPAYGEFKDDKGNYIWGTYSFKVERSGEYTFRWEYYKDTTGSGGQDTAWVGNIEITKAKEEALTGIKLVAPDTSLFQRQTMQLAVNYLPASALPVPVTYESSDPSVAKVDENGLLTAVGGGTAVITATAEGGFTDSITVNVTPVYFPATMPYTDTYRVGEKYVVNMNTFVDMGAESIRYAHGFKVDMKAGEGIFFETAPNALLSSSLPDPKIRVYDSNFTLLTESDNNVYSNDRYYYDNLRFAASEDGTYYVLVFSEQYYTFDVNPNTNTPTTLLDITLSEIEAVQVEKVEIPVRDLNLGVGERAKIHAILLPYDNDFPTVHFESADEKIATVTNEGFVTAVSEGETTINVIVPNGNITEVVNVIVHDEDYTYVPEPDGMIYGFTLASENAPRSFVQYDPKGSTEELKLLAPDDRDFYSALYFDGKVYAYLYQQTSMETYSIQFVTMDAQTFSEQNRVNKGYAVPVDMTYDYTTNTVYATVQDKQNSTLGLATVNLKNGDINMIAGWNLPRGATMMTIEATGDGTLYGIGSDGYLYEIDKTTGKATEVMLMGTATTWFNTMVYDYKDKLMYWFPFTPTGSKVVCFDPNTGDIEFEDSFGDGLVEFVGGMIFQNPENIEPEPEPTYYTVTFLDFNDKVLEEVKVREGRTAMAPTVKHPDGVPFVAWDKDITNVREDMTVKPLALGDVNKDHSITAGDATMVLRDVVSVAPLNDEEKLFADANQNDGVDAGDATIILRYVVGMGWGIK